MIHTLVLVLTVSFSTVALASPPPTEQWVAEKAAYAFDTWIRVKVPAQVVEAEDNRIVGESAAFVQSLLYTANKSSEFQGVFASEAEVRTAIQKDLCPSEHEMDLTPLRHEGSKGERVFRSKIKPFAISVSGKTLKGNTSKSFSVFLVCGKRP
jgi:hypothetical protein